MQPAWARKRASNTVRAFLMTLANLKLAVLKWPPLKRSIKFFFKFFTSTVPVYHESYSVLCFPNIQVESHSV
jgi:hypothetical protein